MREQHIPRGQVPMNTAPGLQIAHAVGNLLRVVEQCADQRPRLLLLTQPVEQGAAGAELENLEEEWRKISRFLLR